MHVDPELTKLLAQLIVRIVIEIGWIVIKHQRTQALDGRRRPGRRKAPQRRAPRRQRARPATHQEPAATEQPGGEETSE